MAPQDCLYKFMHVDYEIVAVKGYDVNAERVLISKSNYSFEDEEKLGLRACEFGALLASDGSLHLQCFVKIEAFNLNADIQKKYKELFEQANWTDYQIQVISEENEVEVINVHKSILSNYGIFQAKFRSNPTQNQMRITDSSAIAVKCFLLYLYCGEIQTELWDEYCFEILILADKFVIESLRHNAECYVASKISDLDDIYRLCEALEKIEACRRFIQENQEGVDNEFWNKIRDKWPRALELLRGR
ncbi:unnamed protein product [Meloidogyne enterolobii]|uniref:Uncharacterized protein n=1 Tax=Meloidogyne enterolobii TaxID=390850 RepID=A0ACB0Z8I2_MELEN